MVRLLWIMLFASAGIGAAAADSAPAQGALSLGGVVQFAPPPAPWFCTDVQQQGKVAVYRNEDGDGRLIVAAIPAHAPRTAAQAELGPGVILDRIRIEFRKNKTEMLLEPELQKDERFFAKIHYRYRRGDETVVSQWHLYRNIAPHQIAVTIISLSRDEAQVEQARLLGESIAMSGQVIPRGRKPPPAPTVAAGPGEERAPVDPAAARAELKAAEAALAAAEKQCLARLEQSPEYQKAQKRAADAEAKVKQLRNASPVDQDALAAASREWIEARSAVGSMRTEAMQSDEQVQEARRRVAEAKARVPATL